MKRGQVVLERHDGAPEAALEPADLDRPRRDPLVRSPYLTAEEAMAHTRRPSVRAFYKWRVKHGVPAYGTLRRQLFLKRDLDEALKPVADRGRRRHFQSLRGGRS